MHGALARAAGGTLAGTNAGDAQRYMREFPRASARWTYAKEMSNWIRGVLYRDHAAWYYPFTLTYTGPLTPGVAAKRFFHASVNASMEWFPALSRSNSRRHHTGRSFGVIVVPCVSASGLFHWHGFIRVPLPAIDGLRDDVLIENDDHGQKMLITGPAALKMMREMLRDQFHPRRGVSTSFAITHRPQQAGRHPRAANHRRYPRATLGMLRYLQGTADGEVRNWRELDMHPHALFTRLAK